MEQGLITIVLPIYNVENYLERCLNSVVNQTYMNLEIILVDDGSSDNCPQICEDWAKKDNRIKVVHKENAGLGMARNTGIENATGEYICFFDSDDYIVRDGIQKAYLLATKENVDLVLFGYSNVNKQGQVVKSTVPRASKVLYQGAEVTDVVLPCLLTQSTNYGELKNLFMSAWTCMYSTELIRKSDWHFVSEREIISEDVYSLLYLYQYIDRVAILSEPLYFYCENATSLTHTYRKDRYEKIKYFYNKCMEAQKEIGYGSNIAQSLAYPYLANIIAALKMIGAAECDNNEKRETFKAIITDEHLQTVLNQLDLKKEALTRKMLFVLMKKRMCSLCYVLIKAKS